MAQQQAFIFDQAMLDAALAQPVARQRMAVVAATDPQLSLLTRARSYVGVQWAGQRNPGGQGKPPYRRSGVFQGSLQLKPIGPELIFSSDAVSPRRAWPYGQNLITGGQPFRGPYRMLPPEFYL